MIIVFILMSLYNTWGTVNPPNLEYPVKLHISRAQLVHDDRLHNLGYL